MDFDDLSMIIIGVVGQIASGKGVLVDYLVKGHGFAAFSLSTIVHEELEKRGIKKFTRQDLQDMGDELRKKYGRNVLARRTIERVKSQDKVAIEGIRNPAEIEYLKTLPNFTLMAVKANRQLRYERLLKRHKPWDPRTWEVFLSVDHRDLGIGQQAVGQQVEKCLAYADHTVTNNGSIEKLDRKIEKLLKKILNF